MEYRERVNVLDMRYEQIAAVIDMNRAMAKEPMARAIVHSIALDLAETFGMTNIRFKREKFLRDCGYSGLVTKSRLSEQAMADSQEAWLKEKKNAK